MVNRTEKERQISRSVTMIRVLGAELEAVVLRARHEGRGSSSGLGCSALTIAERGGQAVYISAEALAGWACCNESGFQRSKRVPDCERVLERCKLL